MLRTSVLDKLYQGNGFVSCCSRFILLDCSLNSLNSLDSPNRNKISASAVSLCVLLDLILLAQILSIELVLESYNNERLFLNKIRHCYSDYYTMEKN